MPNKTYPEIRNQYQAIAKTHDYILQHEAALKDFYARGGFKRLVAIGSGSSYDLSMAVACSANLLLSIPAVPIPAGDLMLRTETYAPVLRDALVLVLSRSGSTDEIVNTINLLAAMSCNVKVLSIVCVEDSRVSKISDYVLEMPWAFDESVCQTRSVSTMYAAAQLVLSIFSDNSEIKKDILTIAEAGDDYFEKTEPLLREIAHENWKKVYVLADGEVSGVAEEAALAFNEICYIPSTCKHLLDLRHGPIVLVDGETLVIAHVNTDGFDYQKALIGDVVNKGAKVIVYSDMPLPEQLEGVRAQIVFGKPLTGSTVAIPMLLIAQLLSYHSAVSRGINPDQPQGLDAWIAL